MRIVQITTKADVTSPNSKTTTRLCVAVPIAVCAFQQPKPNENEKIMIKVLEEKSKERLCVLNKEGIIFRIVYLLALRGTEPLEKRTIYVGHFESKVDIHNGILNFEDTCLLMRPRHHVMRSLKMARGEKFKNKKDNAPKLYVYIVHMMKKFKRGIELHVVKMETIDVKEIEGILNRHQDALQCNEESRIGRELRCWNAQTGWLQSLVKRPK